MMKVLRIFLIVILLLSFTTAQDYLGRLVDKDGEVNIRHAGELSYSNIPVKNSKINSGDALRTGDDGFAEIVFTDDESSIKILNDSELGVEEKYSNRKISLKKGEIVADINPNLAKSYSLETPNSMASLNDVAFEAKVRNHESFKANDGQFEVTNLSSGEKELYEAQTLTISNETIQQNTQVENSETNSNETVDLAYASAPEEEETTDTQDSNGDFQPANNGGSDWNMGLGVGSVTIDGKIYNQIALRPELRFGKLGVGLDLYFYLDENGNIRKEDWDEFSDYLDKIYYLRWGRQGDPFFAQAGALPSVTLGYGILMSGYTNTIEYPQVRNIGLHTGMKFDKLGWEILIADIKELSGPGLIAGRVTYDLMSKFRLGGTFVSDFNQYKGLVDTDEDNIPDVFDYFPNKEFSLPDYYPDGAFGINQEDKLKGKKYAMDSDDDGIPDEIDFDIDGDGLTDNYYIDPSKNVESESEINRQPAPFNIKNQAKAISAVAFDAGVPIVEKDMFKLDLYGQGAFFISEKLTDYYTGEKYNPGWGVAVPGFRTKIFNWVTCNIEYRFSGENFLFSFWDRLYDMERVSIRQVQHLGNPTHLPGDPAQLWAYTKDELKLHNDPMKGVFGSVDYNLFDYLIFSAYYQHMTSKNDEIRSFRSQISIPSGRIPKLAEALAFYQRNNDKNPFKFKDPSENTVLGYRVGIEIGGGAVLSYVYSRTYRDLDGNGNINPDKEAVTINTIETGFRF